MKNDHTSKIIAYDEAFAVFDKLRAKGTRVVQCHGTFDLLHSGHICHLKEARRLGDVLVVTLTGNKHVNKGPGRPYMSELARAETIAELSCVDYVVVVPHVGAVEAIECVKPKIYCKGKEYVDTTVDVTGNIHHDLKTVKKYDGEVAYVGDIVFSSTKILNNHFDVHDISTKAFCKKIAEKYSVDDFKAAVNGLSDIRVMVVGDIIFDKYSYLKVQGLTSKNQILSGRFIEEDVQYGGALAVYRHLREFTKNVQLVSLAGTEKWVSKELSKCLDVTSDNVIREESFTTVLKQRYVEKTEYDGKEMNKLFAVNYIDDEEPDAKVIDRVLKKIKASLSKVDMVLLIDFGHGLLTERVRDLLQNKAPYIALNCQTNSNNFGFNIINKKYQRAESFSLDKQEMLLAEGTKKFDYLESLKGLSKHFSAKYGWLTRGGVTTIGVRNAKESVECPPLERNIIDTVGAGDAFCAVASMAAYKEYPIALATFMGQLAGAQAVRIVGNSKPISKVNLLKSGMSLLNF